jgi:hypothetical protein
MRSEAFSGENKDCDAMQFCTRLQTFLQNTSNHLQNCKALQQTEPQSRPVHGHSKASILLVRFEVFGGKNVDLS